MARVTQQVLSGMSDIIEVSDMIAINDLIAAIDMSCMRHTSWNTDTNTDMNNCNSFNNKYFCLYVREGGASSANCLPLLAPM